jgi:SulP family sulfate permease
VFLLAFLLVAAPLASHVPLAALAGVLAVVAWNMADKGEVGRVLMQRDGEAAVLATTFLLIIFVDLMVGMIAGCALAGFIALWRKRAA